jgi:hypothetical protein
MFFRVLGAMVVADAFDRRARRRAAHRRNPPLELSTHRLAPGASRTSSAWAVERQPGPWDRRAPERPIWPR